MAELIGRKKIQKDILWRVDGDDRVSWARERSGHYSVESDYRIAFYLFHPPIEYLPPISRKKQLWNSLWNLCCTVKMKVFLWKAF
ncbi:hypothetical protein PIB30_006124 [Stylosanthes scabra]|uniref:Reverse transcriptase zinc-binding domain-containing protein n=1 Tax=Stylosanthes scabra TaxID=79078 RepID=A0ABU6W2B7_9FABA|nr:hypothetical protein [Stylosanthes scabra]